MSIKKILEELVRDTYAINRINKDVFVIEQLNDKAVAQAHTAIMKELEGMIPSPLKSTVSKL